MSSEREIASNVREYRSGRGRIWFVTKLNLRNWSAMKREELYKPCVMFAFFPHAPAIM